jgi:hypothetical protein
MVSDRTWISLPKWRTEMATKGKGMSTQKLKVGDRRNIRTTARIMVSTVVALYMMPGPRIMRTALRSLVARDISSPVRLRT